jgi:hypothetical protein
MATWQFSTFYATHSVVENVIGKSSLHWNEISDLEPLRTLQAARLSEVSLPPLIGNMKMLESWSKVGRFFGEMDGDRVDVIFKDGYIEEIAIRIDVRKLNRKFLRRIIDFAKSHGLVLIIVESQKAISPEVGHLLDSISRSKSFSFVENPNEFLSNIQTKRKFDS